MDLCLSLLPAGFAGIPAGTVHTIDIITKSTLENLLESLLERAALREE
jgi:hypothetical protein